MLGEVTGPGGVLASATSSGCGRQSRQFPDGGARATPCPSIMGSFDSMMVDERRWGCLQGRSKRRR